VEAATRCEHANFELACTSLPPIFLFAVTRNQVHVLRELHDGTHFVGAAVVRSWDRAGFQTKLLHEQGNRAMAMADNQRVFYLRLPPDAFTDPFHQQMASRFMSMGRSGTPVEFIIARDDSSQRVIDVMGIQVARMVTGTPQPAGVPAFGAVHRRAPSGPRIAPCRRCDH
jgi:hypothetical protein